jgi:hypothetical protein
VECRRGLLPNPGRDHNMKSHNLLIKTAHTGMLSLSSGLTAFPIYSIFRRPQYIKAKLKPST